MKDSIITMGIITIEVEIITIIIMKIDSKNIDNIIKNLILDIMITINQNHLKNINKNQQNNNIL